MSSPVLWPMASSYFTGSPSPVRDVSYSITGTKGSTTYYYWVVANYTWGSVAPRAPLIVSNAPDVLGVTGSIVLSWIQPSSQIVNYSVLRTTTNLFPGSSTTAVIVNTTNTTVTDTGAALVAFTFTAIPAMKATVFIDGAGPTPVLVTSVGMQVSGSVSGTSFNTVSAVTGASVNTVSSWHSYTVTLVGANWQITAFDGTVTLVPTAAAASQNIPLATLPPNVYVLSLFRVVQISGPSGGTTTASVASIGIPTIPVFYANIGLSLQTVPSNTTFLDINGSPGANVVNTPQVVTVTVTTSGGNVNAITGPCSFAVYINWGVTN